MPFRLRLRVLSVLLFVLVLSVYFYRARPREAPHLAVHDHPPFPCDATGPAKRVAIIGAGSAGSSTAYYLRHYTKSCPREFLNITVYDREPYIGGRSTTVFAHDDPRYPVELGASIFVKVNHNLMHAVKKFGLKTIGLGGGDEFVDSAKILDGEKKVIADIVGVYDGANWVYMSPETDPAGGWWTAAKLLWQYGWEPIATRRLMQSVVSRFLQLYSPPHFPFTDLTRAAAAVDLSETAGLTGQAFLKGEGLGGLFSQDIIQASTRVNYAQNLDTIHGVETMVCMATEGAMSVQGGNWQIFANMLADSESRAVLNSTVASIRHTGPHDKTYAVMSDHGDGRSLESIYDVVVIAAPLAFADIKISPAPLNPIPDTPYVTLHVTLFSSPFALNPSAFGLPVDAKVPSTILTTLAKDHPQKGPELEFFSISTLNLVRNPHTKEIEYLYKIFSPAELEDLWLKDILATPPQRSNEAGRQASNSDEVILTWIHRKVWQSYPVESPRQEFDDIIMPLQPLTTSSDKQAVQGKLYYTNGIEPFISTMETSSLMGANVARLIVDEWAAERAHNAKGNRRSDEQAVPSEL